MVFLILDSQKKRRKSGIDYIDYFITFISQCYNFHIFHFGRSDHFNLKGDFKSRYNEKFKETKSKEIKYSSTNQKKKQTLFT